LSHYNGKSNFYCRIIQISPVVRLNPKGFVREVYRNKKTLPIIIRIPIIKLGKYRFKYYLWILKNTNMLVEVPVFSLESAIAAYKAGAHRIELCAAPAEGGLTPSAATLRLTKKYVLIPVHVMIRPREGDFCYSEKEFETMLLDIMAAKTTGCEGVVAGILKPDGSVDKTRLAILVEAAYPMNVTFHRAFDMSKDLDESLEAIIGTGCSRILTSGGKQTALQGINKIAELKLKANHRVTIMPGSGINAENCKHIASVTSAHELHLSARRFVPGQMKFRQTSLTMGALAAIPDYDIQQPDDKVIKDILQQFGGVS
jgi:copper homeostasis protein